MRFTLGCPSETGSCTRWDATRRLHTRISADVMPSLRGHREVQHGQHLGVCPSCHRAVVSVAMPAAKRKRAPGPSKKPPSRRRLNDGVEGSVPKAADIYGELLSEATETSSSTQEASRPLKRRKAGHATIKPPANDRDVHVNYCSDAQSDISIARPQQTIYDDSNSPASSDDEETWEEVGLHGEDSGTYHNIDAHSTSEKSQITGVELVLGQNDNQPSKRMVSRRAPLTVVEKSKRLSIHKVHLCCLLTHVHIRNSWCNLPEVHVSCGSC